MLTSHFSVNCEADRETFGVFFRGQSPGDTKQHHIHQRNETCNVFQIWYGTFLHQSFWKQLKLCLFLFYLMFYWVLVLSQNLSTMVLHGEISFNCLLVTTRGGFQRSMLRFSSNRSLVCLFSCVFRTKMFSGESCNAQFTAPRSETVNITL